VIFEEQRLTYAELERESDALAAELRRHGVGPEVTVGVCMERSIELVVALLAVLKAGGAYVPLDPSYPRERLRFMIEDAAPAVVLTQSWLSETLPAFEATTVLFVDEEFARDGVDVQRNTRSLDNAAYVIYTSGSTGTPKGVVVTHANVVRLFSATQSWFNFDDRDVWTCSILTLSTFQCGNCGARCFTADGW
jgi:non-ribosomal peptide synthetase component F